MIVDHSKMSEMFQKAKDEDSVDIVEVLEIERPLLYDYLLRMTGQITRAQETIEELYRVAPPQIENHEDWASFRCLLYTTARNFNLDAWNAETNSLENSGLKKITDVNQLMSKIDQYVRFLPGAYREIFVCVFIYQFSFEDLAKVIKQMAPQIEADAQAILADLSKLSGVKEKELSTRLATFPLHLPKGANSNNTVALSQVVGNMEEVENSRRSERIKRIFFILMLVAVAAVSAYFLGLFDEYLQFPR